MRSNAPCINLLKKLQLIKSLLQLILVQVQSSVCIDKNMDFEEYYFRLMSYLPINKLHILQFCPSADLVVFTTKDTVNNLQKGWLMLYGQ